MNGNTTPELHGTQNMRVHYLPHLACLVITVSWIFYLLNSSRTCPLLSIPLTSATTNSAWAITTASWPISLLPATSFQAKTYPGSSSLKRWNLTVLLPFVKVFIGYLRPQCCVWHSHRANRVLPDLWLPLPPSLTPVCKLGFMSCLLSPTSNKTKQNPFPPPL